jgi:hypothetical protein
MTQRRSKSLIVSIAVVLVTMGGFATAHSAEQRRVIVGLGFGPNYHDIRTSYSGFRIVAMDSSHRQVVVNGSSSTAGTGASIQVLLGYAHSRSLQFHLSATEDLEHVILLSSESVPEEKLQISQALITLGADYRPQGEEGRWFVSGGAGFGMVPNDRAHGPALSVGGGRDLARIFQARLVFGYLRYEQHGAAGQGFEHSADRLNAILLLSMVRH